MEIKDNVHSQNYYILANGLSASDYIFKGKLKFSRGNAFKYVSRAGRKSNNSTESDLNKALSYILCSEKEFSFAESVFLGVRNTFMFYNKISEDKEVDLILHAIICFEKKEIIAKLIVSYMRKLNIAIKPEYKCYE